MAKTQLSKGQPIDPAIQKEAVKWAKGTLTTGELGALWEFDRHQTTQVLYRAAVALREAVRAGLLK